MWCAASGRVSPSNATRLTLERYGEVHVLVNNAAIQVSKTIEGTTPEEWNRQMAVNTSCLAWGAREARSRICLR